MRKQQVSERCKKALLAVINSVQEHRDPSKMRYHSKKLAPKWQVMAAQAIDNGFVCPRIEYLCEATGYSNRQVREARIQLIQEGRLDAFPTKICYLMWVKTAEVLAVKSEQKARVATYNRQDLPPITVHKNCSEERKQYIERSISGRSEPALTAPVQEPSKVPKLPDRFPTAREIPFWESVGIEGVAGKDVPF